MGKLMQLICIIGNFFGLIKRVLYPKKLRYLIYQFKRSVATSYWRKSFGSFGHGSLISPNITTIKPKFISIGDNSSVLSHSVLEAVLTEGKVPNLTIGNGVSIGEYCHITCANHIKIGSGVLTGRFVLITDNSHGASDGTMNDISPLGRPIVSPGAVIIEDNVWIGDKVTILPNVHIGKGSIIAANAVVTKDVPAYCIAAGIPAKVVRNMANN